MFGFLPAIAVRTAFRNSELVRRYKRLVFRKALRHVTSQIREISSTPERGFVITVNGKCECVLNHCSFFILIQHFLSTFEFLFSLRTKKIWLVASLGCMLLLNAVDLATVATWIFLRIILLMLALQEI